MNTLIPGLLLTAFLSCGQTTSHRQAGQHNASIAKDSCDNPDAPIGCSFVNMSASLSNTISIGSKNEPGERLTISGTMYKADGKTAYPNIILYAYHTDSKGYYAKNGTETAAQKWHGRLHGWCKTGSDGRYTIETTRPARYPGNTIPAHIHAAIKKDDGKMYWISDFVFSDDDLIDERYRSAMTNKIGGTGVVSIARNAENTWTGQRDIILTQ
jgi:protocatechuate 3,4-dioxygenase, beta subunit